jgi:aspartyl-tRNA(Asn)/glutamyl-tRNA(Gln) amidotransferase subunit A
VIEGEVFPLRQLVRATVPFNLTGSPALSVPFGWSREGLPIGVQVVGRHFDETTVLRLGMALEAIHAPRRRACRPRAA